MKKRLFFHTILILFCVIVLPFQDKYVLARSDEWCIGDPVFLVDGTLVDVEIWIPLQQLSNVIEQGGVDLVITVPKEVNQVEVVLNPNLPFPINITIEKKGHVRLDTYMDTKTFVPRGNAPSDFNVQVHHLTVNVLPVNVPAYSLATGQSNSNIYGRIVVERKSLINISVPLLD